MVVVVAAFCGHIQLLRVSTRLHVGTNARGALLMSAFGISLLTFYANRT